MGLNFLSKSLSAFGLDIGPGSFKIMLLGKNGKDTIVKAYSEIPVPKNLMVNDVIEDSKTFNHILKQGLQKPQFGKIDTNYVVVNLPESKSFVRVIQIPKMSVAEAENAVPFEAESFIPLPIDQVYLDWEKIGETEDKMNILMIASPKDYVNHYLELLDGAGLKTIALEVESQSSHRALITPGAKETVLVVDLDAFRTSLVMVEEGTLQFTSTVPIAGNTFTESIARTLGISSAKAEEIKRKVGIANTAEYPNIKTSLLPVLNNLSAEIKNILKFHGEHSDKKVERILLMGGSAKLKNLPEFLLPNLVEVGVTKVELANPWQNLTGNKAAPFDPFESLGFVTSIGLGMRGINFEVS